MRVRTLSGQPQKTHVVILDRGEEVSATLASFAASEDIRSAHLSAIGAFSEIVLGFFDREQKRYQEIPMREQVEVLALTGNFSTERGAPRIHMHAVVGKRDGSAHGGHLLRGVVSPTLEAVVVELPGALERRFDPESGLALLDGTLNLRPARGQ
jgi:predicted DNA-binding protein with PD1-like motif